MLTLFSLTHLAQKKREGKLSNTRHIDIKKDLTGPLCCSNIAKVKGEDMNISTCDCGHMKALITSHYNVTLDQWFSK